MLNRIGTIIYSIGIVLLMLGAMAADSPSLLAPFSLIAAGAGCVYVGRRFGNDEDR